MLSVLKILTVFLTMQLAAGSGSGLNQLLVDGPDLHSSLKTIQLENYPVRHLPSDQIPGNPHHSTDPGFVNAIARSSSQGRLDATGIESVLYALYLGEDEVGIYGLETADDAEADRREKLLRDIWKKNASLDRAQVHRAGRTLIVVWTDGVSPEAWSSVNAAVEQRISLAE